jgi:hypothetical protein
MPRPRTQTERTKDRMPPVQDLETGADGSLTIYAEADPPTDPAQWANGLPAPKGQNLSLYVRAYWPKEEILNGKWSPPAVRPAV